MSLSTAEAACVYSALILHDEDIEITVCHSIALGERCRLYLKTLPLVPNLERTTGV